MSQRGASGWIPTEPAPIVPVPAAHVPDLRGRRVIVGEAGQGWRYDLRADDPVLHGGRTHVPVLAEHDYYHSELDQVEVFAPLIPIEHVWVEHRLVRQAGVEPSGLPNELVEDELTQLGRRVGGEFLTRLVDLGAPPPRAPLPVRDVPGVTGRRVVLVSPDGEQRDLRAMSEPYQNAEGDICVRVCAESLWYRWTLSGQTPRSTETPIYLLWVE